MVSSTHKTLYTRGVLLLILTTLVWGTSFPLLKGMVGSVSPAVIVAVRFTIAAVVLSPWLRQVNQSLIRDGALLGLLYFSECVLTLIGLDTIPANRAAFIISLNVILVPLLGLLVGQRLSVRVFLAAAVALSGVGVMAWEGGGFGSGDALVFCSALGCAVYILLLGITTRRHPTLPLVAMQLLVMAILGMIWALPHLFQQGNAIAQHFSTLLYLSLVVTATPVLTQTIAQQWVAAHQAALLYTLEPVFAAIFSFWLLGETFGIRSFIGAGLVLAATALSQTAVPVNPPGE